MSLQFLFFFIKITCLFISSEYDISKLTDLPLEIINEIFGYLTLGDVFYSFYYINNVSMRYIFLIK